MLVFLVMAVVLYGVGAVLGIKRRARWIMIAVLYVCFFIASVLLPTTSPFRIMSDPEAWLVTGGLIVVSLIYAWGLRWLRSRAKEPETTLNEGSFSDTELNRYARHIVLREIGGLGQKKLKEAKVLVVGAGGLGSPALLYLAAAGVGTIGVIDDDMVENSNLQRQVIHRDDAIGMPKVFSAKAAMLARNPFVSVKPYHRRLTGEEGNALIAEYDVVLDGTDNFETRYLVNRICFEQAKPLISGALSQWEGQLSVFDPASGTPCYQCIFPQQPAEGSAPSCAEAGVIGPLPGIVGAMMAAEAIKVITDAGAALHGDMMLYDALWGEIRKIQLKPRGDCPVCGSRPSKKIAAA
ncbi:HesA/MoeB/ThiF family protein [Pseudopelagicola sp. nBUS_19]|uniref:HesA/MoeB/ThiF family protein n=1 Tax=Pseudopelagicola sp. nBUS_19 TaxID=3395316 RepID=UPI003EB94E30